MGVCGFNMKMGRGLTILFEGMYEAIHQKATAEGMTFAEVLKRELLEIPAISEWLGRSQDPALAMFYGLNMMALPHFKQVLERLVSATGQVDKEQFMAEVLRFVDTLKRVEEFSESLPKPPLKNGSEVIARASSIGAWAYERHEEQVARAP